MTDCLHLGKKENLTERVKYQNRGPEGPKPFLHFNSLEGGRGVRRGWRPRTAEHPVLEIYSGNMNLCCMVHWRLVGLES